MTTTFNQSGEPRAPHNQGRYKMIKVTWKRYRNDTEPKEKFFDSYLDAKVFFMFLQKAKWATCPTLTDIGYDHAHHSFSR